MYVCVLPSFFALTCMYVYVLAKISFARQKQKQEKNEKSAKNWN